MTMLFHNLIITTFVCIVNYISILMGCLTRLSDVNELYFMIS
ncbi:unnamed protein product [Spodoptera exigua]|nr:unnamed protein product [Spodoptera exigua]